MAVKVWANAILTVGSPECLTVRLTVRSQWADCYRCTVSSWMAHSKLTVWAASSQCELQAHGVSCKLTVWVANSRRAHSKLILWFRCEVDEWLQNELAVSFHMSSQCVSCELKFFTGWICMRNEARKTYGASCSSQRAHGKLTEWAHLVSLLCMR